MPFFIPFLIIGAVTLAAVLTANEDEQKELPEDWITFVGPSSAGKSRLANDVLGVSAFAVGAEHGTTTRAQSATFRGSWSLVDTPGLLDGVQLAEIAAQAARRSKIIVVCLDGEMCRQTFEWLEGLLLSIRHGQQVVIVPCLTKSDLRECMMPVRDQLKISHRLSEQIQKLRSIAEQKNIRIEDLQEGSLGRRAEVVDKIQWATVWING